MVYEIKNVVLLIDILYLSVVCCLLITSEACVRSRTLHEGFVVKNMAPWTGFSANTVIPRLTSDPANEFFG